MTSAYAAAICLDCKAAINNASCGKPHPADAEQFCVLPPHKRGKCQFAYA